MTDQHSETRHVTVRKHGPGGRCPGYLLTEHIDGDPGRITCPWCALEPKGKR